MGGMSKSNKADDLSKAVKKFLEDTATIPPWGSAGKVWASKIKELHTAYCDYEETKDIDEMKLFIWTDFCPDYSGGLAIAIVRDEIEARKQIEKKMDYGVCSWGRLEIKPLTKRIARAVSGGS